MRKKIKLLKILIYSLTGILFTASCTSVTYAKYVFSTFFSDNSANVAKFGTIELKEHKPELQNDGTYKLNEEEIPAGYNEYVVYPGVDIPKDPFVIVRGVVEVPCKLYLKITKTNFPTYTYYNPEIRDYEPVIKCIVDDELWEKDESVTDSEVYEYKKEVETDKEINILRDKMLVVSCGFQWQRNQSFEITFEAWMHQVL